MRGAHRVDVELLHQRDVALLRGLRHVPAVVGVGLGPVHALEQHPLAVDQQLLVADLDLAETDRLTGDVRGPPVGAGEGEHDGVQVRRLVGPLGRVAHGHGELDVGPGTGHVRRPAGRGDLVAPRVAQARGDAVHAGRATGLVAELDGRGQRRVGVRGVQVGPQRHVLDVGRRGGAQRDRAEDARVPPLVVVLQVRARAPPVHLHGDPVVAGPQRPRDVELGGRVAALVVADVPAVDPDEVAGRDTLEAEHGRPLRPARREVEVPGVGAGRVDVAGHVRRVVRLDLGGDVAEDRVVQAVGLPRVRHRHGPPRRGVVAVGVEPGGHLLRRLGHRDLPLPVQRQRVRRPLLAPRGRADVGVGEHTSRPAVERQGATTRTSTVDSRDRTGPVSCRRTPHGRGRTCPRRAPAPLRVVGVHDRETTSVERHGQVPPTRHRRCGTTWRCRAPVTSTVGQVSVTRGSARPTL